MNEIVDTLWSAWPYSADYIQASSDYLNAKNIPERAGLVKDTFLEEINKDESFKERFKKKLALGGLAVSLALEWGPVSELIAAVPTIAVLQATNGNVVVAAAAGAAIYAGQQGVYGSVASAAINSIPETEKEFHEQFNTAEEEVMTGENFALLLGAGEAVVIGNKHLRDENRDFKQDMKTVGKMTLQLLAFDFLVFGGASYAIENSDKVNIDQATVIDIATNPMTYILVFGGLRAASHLKKSYKNRNSTKVVGKTKAIEIET